MEKKVSELTGAGLDWAVAKCEGTLYADHGFSEMEIFHAARSGGRERYSTDWSQGGPIIEREAIGIVKFSQADGWQAFLLYPYEVTVDVAMDETITGPTPLIAAMRVFVSSKLGEEVEIPEELS